MSSLPSDTVDEFRKNYDKYLEKTVEKIEKLEDARKAIETNMKDVIKEGLFSPVELKNRKIKKDAALRGLKKEQETAEGIRSRLMQPSKEDTDEKFIKEIGGLKFYNAGEWKD